MWVLGDVVVYVLVQSPFCRCKSPYPYLVAKVLHGDSDSLFIRIHRVQLLLRAQGDIGKQLSLLYAQLHIQSEIMFSRQLLKPRIQTISLSYH